jgi:hypothetical protein
VDEFIRKHGEVIEGVLSCFDRMLFRGYLPISDQFPSVDWVRVLGRYARRINPLLGELLRARESVRANVSAGDDPSLVARAVLEAATAQKPRLRYPVGSAPGCSRGCGGSCRPASSTPRCASSSGSTPFRPETAA